MKTNLSYKITGDNLEHLKRFTPYCRKKINMLGWMVMLPAIVWLIVGYTISREMLGNSIFASIVTALVCSTIIFLLEFAILRADGGKPIFWFRFLLGLALAFVSGLAIDSLVFKSDVDWYLKQKYNHKAEVAYSEAMNKYVGLIQLQETKTTKAKTDWNNSIDELNAEMNGTGGTRIPGYDKASNKKEQLKNEAKDEYNKHVKALEQLKQEQKAMADSARINVLQSSGINTFMHRINNLHEMVFSNWGTGFFYILFFFIAFYFELMVVVMKTFSRKSAYEKHLETVEQILESKNRQYLRERNYMDALGYSGRSASKKSINSNKHSLIN